MKLYSIVMTLVLFAFEGHSFCGFYVGKADSKLFNEASQVVMVREGEKTVLTMSNDYKGELKEFALVVPVPTVLEREQINVSDKKYIDRIDAFTSPRLVEYFDNDPCAPQIRYEKGMMMQSSAPSGSGGQSDKSAKALGVTIEAKYTIGEYDILILSAKQSGGLVTWLKDNKYNVPAGTEAILGSYINQNLKFFVAKVNLKEQAKTGFTFLRPIQIAFNSPRFMLPIRLGTVNANGPQDLVIMAITKKGRVETTNYRTVKIPTDQNIPVYTKSDFGSVYKAMFAEQVRREDMKAVFLEHAWDMSWCDPCASEPLTKDELENLGVFWLNDPAENQNRPIWPGSAGAVNAFVTRLHVRYTAEKFPDDLIFNETPNRENFQGRYILTHPYKGSMACSAAEQYKNSVKSRQDVEAKTLASITGWKIEDVRKKMDLPEEPAKSEDKWWKKLWKKETNKQGS